MAVFTALMEERALKAARVLAGFAPVRAVILFGSQIEGRADEWSDLDVAVFMEGLESWDFVQRIRAMGEAQREAGYDIEPHLFPASSFDHPDPASFAAYVIKHGVRIDSGE